MKLSNKKIIFLGDSITEGVGATEQTGGYVKVIQRTTRANCINCGISGTRIARQKNPTVDCPSFDKDFCMRAAELTDPADIFVIFGGTNDYGHGDAPFGTADDRTVDTFCGALHVLYQTVKKNQPQAKIVVLTPIYSQTGETIKNPTNGLFLPSYAEQIRKTAAMYDLPVLDLYRNKPGSEEPLFDSSFLADGLHPNDEGHKVLAKYIINFLESEI